MSKQSIMSEYFCRSDEGDCGSMIKAASPERAAESYVWRRWWSGGCQQPNWSVIVTQAGQLWEFEAEGYAEMFFQVTPKKQKNKRHHACDERGA